MVALLFLVILTLLGTTGVMTNTLQERMAANSRNRNLAFQAAEYAIDAANTWMSTQTKASISALVGTSSGIRANGESHDNDAEYWQGATWTSDVVSPPTPPGGALAAVASQPVYVVEQLPPDIDCDLATPGNQPCDYYRVTARGVGGTTDATVILQTLYKIQ